MTILKIGEKAPDFTLISSERKPVSLNEYKGKPTVILFYPGAFSGVCTTELCSVRDDISAYNDLNAEVIGISTDTFFTLAKFKELNKLTFTLLSDYNKEVNAQYGAKYDTWIEGMKGNAKRSAFVLDREGIIQYAEVLDNALENPNFEKIKETLKQINAVVKA
ncbi:MAG TPA: peroxiredoxin [Bacteroidia bacterium]|nr:peroxiredoxin [Bacteroidia bacterium]HNT80801.1 peroxiredoxin [Bacteroidia bacterium]